MSDDVDIGHDPIISDGANIASPDLSDASRLILVDMNYVSDGLRIKAARKSVGLTQAELAEQMGVTQSVVSDWETGKLQSWREVGEKLALKTGQPKGYFSTPKNSAIETAELQVVGEVQAGVFREALEIPPEERITVPVVTVRGYEDVRLVALKVVGPSMDLVYPDGSFVIVASTFDTDVRNGDRVVVYRQQGALREATLKEVRVDPTGRVGLWPRSSHPDFQTPIFLGDNDQDGPEIAYVVVGRYADEDRPPAPVRLNLNRQKRAG